MYVPGINPAILIEVNAYGFFQAQQPGDNYTFRHFSTSKLSFISFVF